MKIESRVIIQSNSSMGDLIETTHHSQIPHVQENTGISQRTPSFVNLREITEEIPACNERCRYSTVDIPPSHTTWRLVIYQNWSSQTLEACETTRVRSGPDRRHLISDQKPYYKVQQYPHDLDLQKVLLGNRG